MTNRDRFLATFFTGKPVTVQFYGPTSRCVNGYIIEKHAGHYQVFTKDSHNRAERWRQQNLWGGDNELEDKDSPSGYLVQ